MRKDYLFTYTIYIFTYFTYLVIFLFIIEGKERDLN